MVNYIHLISIAVRLPLAGAIALGTKMWFYSSRVGWNFGSNVPPVTGSRLVALVSSVNRPVISIVFVAAMLIVASGTAGATPVADRAVEQSDQGKNAKAATRGECTDLNAVKEVTFESDSPPDDPADVGERIRIDVSAKFGGSMNLHSGSLHPIRTEDINISQIDFESIFFPEGLVNVESGLGFSMDMGIIHVQGSDIVVNFSQPGKYRVESVKIAADGQAKNIMSDEEEAFHSRDELGQWTDIRIVCSELVTETIEVGDCEAKFDELEREHEDVAEAAREIDESIRALDAIHDGYWGRMAMASGTTLLGFGATMIPGGQVPGMSLMVGGLGMTAAGPDRLAQMQKADADYRQAIKHYNDVRNEYEETKDYVQNCHGYQGYSEIGSVPIPDALE